jgi:hypothetical protein
MSYHDIIQVLPLVHAHVVVPKDLRLLQTHLIVVGGVHLLVYAHYLLSSLIEIKERIGSTAFQSRLPLLFPYILFAFCHVLQVLHLFVFGQIPRE